MDILAHRFKAESVAVHYDPVEGLKAGINTSELSQVLLNLLLNSVHAITGGGDITITTGRVGGSLWVEVADSGCGVPESVRGQIFDAFFTTREQGDGTGLGLSISAQMLADCGGGLSLVDSEQGARFRVVLQAAVAE
jgi:two-component system NtrC family sensor kinase